MENLTFLSPTSYLILCFLGALLFSLILYFRTKQFSEEPQWKKGLLGIIRFLILFGISALLLSPFLKYNQSTTAQPIIVVGLDQSASIQSETAEPELSQFKRDYANLIADLEKDFDVKTFGFGESIREGTIDSFPDKVTNISAFIQYVSDQFNDRNLGAVLLASDGIYNEGKNPIYTHNSINAPIYTVAFGDTTIKKDAWIKRAFHNEIAYLGDQFKIQVDVSANNCLGGRSALVVYKVNGEELKEMNRTPLQYDDNEYFKTFEVVLPAEDPGVQRYRLALNPVSDESTNSNNYKDIFIDILDARQKILIYAKAPHPDLSALKQSLLINQNYEVDVKIYPDLDQAVANYDFVILHQLPGRRADITDVLSQLNERKIGRLFVVGSESDLTAFNRIQNIVRIEARLQNTNEVQGQLNPGFNLFGLDDQLRNTIQQFPPLIAPFGEFSANPTADVLMNQYIGSIETDYPLLAFDEEGDIKTGVLLGEGIWKWRLFDFLQNNNQEISNELINKSIQFLSLKEDKRKFKVVASQKIYRENEEILLDAELYNASYELINDPDVTVSIYNEAGEEFPFTFDRVQNFYTLNAGLFPVGNYRYVARTTDNNQQLTFNGRFSIQPIQLESYNTTADHGMLRILANHRNGQMIYPNQVNELASTIRNRADVKPVVYSNVRTQSLLNIRWVALILIFLLALEWFLRRFWGGY